MKKCLICLIFLIGCSVSDKGIKTAYRICEPHGGVDRIESKAIDSDDFFVTCADGVKIDYKFGRK